MKKYYREFNFIRNSLLITLIIFLFIINISSAATEDIDGDSDGLIDISSIEQLNNIRYNVNGTSYKTSLIDTGSTKGCPIATTTRTDGSSGIGCYGYELTKSLDFNSTSSYSSGSVNTLYTTGSGWLSIENKFSSIFDGNGYSIYNLYINNNATITTKYGFFSSTADNSIIQNISLVNPSISIISPSSETYTGGLVGSGSGIFRNIAIIGGNINNESTAGSKVGALIGFFDYTIGYISNTAIIGTKISSINGQMGGILGFSFSPNINHTYSISKELRYNTNTIQGQIAGNIVNTNTTDNPDSNFNNNFYVNDYSNLYTPITSIIPLLSSSNTPFGVPDPLSSTAISATLNDFKGSGSNNLSTSNLGNGFSYIIGSLPKVKLYNSILTLDIFNSNIVSNFLNSINSSSIAISVSVFPVIISQPTTSIPIINTGNMTKIYSSATSSTGTLSYQWQSSIDNLTFTNISDATSSYYTTPIHSATGTIYYRLIIINTERNKSPSSIISQSVILRIITQPLSTSSTSTPSVISTTSSLTPSNSISSGGIISWGGGGYYYNNFNNNNKNISTIEIGNSINKVINNTTTLGRLFINNIKIFSSSIEVKELQKFLNIKGYILSNNGSGSPGKETTYFGHLTISAIKKYQKANGLIETGLLDTVTRNVINNEIKSQSQNNISKPTKINIIDYKTEITAHAIINNSNKRSFNKSIPIIKI